MIHKKVFFLHIPKTAGSTMNKFLISQFNESEALTHIESKIDLSKPDDIQKANRFNLLSGHIHLPHIQQKMQVLNQRTTIVTLRNPIEHVVSHIAWVRKLGDPSEAQRLQMHNVTVQKIVKKLLQVDLSNPLEIKKLIYWLEEENIYLFHNTQIKYLGGWGKEVTPIIVKNALTNLKKIHFVGITERIGELQILLCGRLGWKIPHETMPVENKNETYYGLDIQNAKIREVLQPLIRWDHLIYQEARERFIKDMHKFLSDFEKEKGPRYTTSKVHFLMNEFKENI